MHKLRFLIALLILSACSTEAEPTPDMNALVAVAVAEQEYQAARVAPVLQTPDDNARFDNIAAVKLGWDWSRPLADDEVFDVRVWREDDPHNGIAWTQDSSFDLTQYLLFQEAGDFAWTVTVLKKDAGGGEAQEISDIATERHFTMTEMKMDILDVPEGFEAKLYAHLPISQPTVMSFNDRGALEVLSLDGHIVEMTDTDEDGYAETASMIYEDPDDQLNHAVGMTYREGQTYISDAGRISILSDEDDDGTLDTLQPIAEGLPTWQHTFHSNNGIAFGPDDKLYVSVGSTTDHGPLQMENEASILRMNPDGTEMEVFATGFRNAYDLAFSPAGELFTADNSPDEPDETLPYLPPEELNFVQAGKNYGFPYVYGTAGSNDQYTAPVTELFTSSASSGLTYYSADQYPPEYQGIFLAQFGTGAGFSKALGLTNGQQVVFVSLQPDGKGGYTGKWQPFARFRTEFGVYNPIDVTVGPDGALYVTEWNTTTVFRIAYVGSDATKVNELAADSAPAPQSAGEIIFRNGTNGAPACVTCHVVDSSAAGVGPSLLGLNAVAGMRVDGLSAEEYVRQSILHPNEYMVDGYIAGVMYQNYEGQLSETDVDALVEYVLSLEK
ncbi:MAG: PQQ-dependent sugar dehydrogenase [Chloroflexi bacterium]|nr:PQQ-dependent sugar dehydrogenase [Chloroflexota bacterium]MCC6894711.1 PQQ-dependent sugar dehydrogenase [Anaerolineae bacterium]